MNDIRFDFEDALEAIIETYPKAKNGNRLGLSNDLLPFCSHGDPENVPPAFRDSDSATSGSRSVTTSEGRSEGGPQAGSRQTVCRYFLMGRCMKGKACEFAHKFDEANMDWCKFGTACARRPHCPFIHIDQLKSVKECEAYEAGFCPNGPICKKRHTRKLPDELPRVARIILDEISNRGRILEEEEKRKALFKTSLCNAWKEGRCRRGSKDPKGCSFAHGYTDLSPKGVARLEGRRWYTDPITKIKVYLDGHGQWWRRNEAKKLVKVDPGEA